MKTLFNIQHIVLLMIQTVTSASK